MYPTLYHIFKDWLNVEWEWMKLLNSFGFFVALAFIIANYFLSREIRRKEIEGLLQPEKRTIVVGKPVSWSDVGINALIGFIFGWKVLYLLMNASALFAPGTLPQKHIFSMEGNVLMGLLLALVFGAWKWWEYRKQALPEPVEKEITFHKHQYVGNITLIAAFFGIVGAKLFHLLENPAEFMLFFKEPSLENFLSGLTIYGGLIVGGAAVIIYGRRKGIPSLHLIDSGAPSLILSYGIGRIGCQISGDGDWGIANAAPKPSWLNWAPDWLWAYHYPNNVNGVGARIPDGSSWPVFEGYGTYLDPAVFPTPVYETTMAVIIFAVLWALRRRLKIPGFMFGLYLALNGFERFWIEKIRVNSVYQIFGMNITQAEIISVMFMIAGITMMLLLRSRFRKSANALADG
jgi:prolipoprotein diacylglyceryltransferase